MRGNTETLKATINPTDADDKNITWTSSNTNVATVNSSGKVTAIAKGTTTITVKTSDGGYTANCLVTEDNPQLTASVSHEDSQRYQMCVKEKKKGQLTPFYLFFDLLS